MEQNLSYASVPVMDTDMRHFAAGAMAGTSATVASFPLDTVRLRLQVREPWGGFNLMMSL